MTENIFYIIQLIAMVICFLIGKFVVPRVPNETIQDVTAKVNLIINYADKFVSWAKYFMKDSTGKDKMAEVMKQLKNIAERYNLDISDDEIQAIVQKAYDSMQAGIEATETEKKKAEAFTTSANNSIILPITAASEKHDPFEMVPLKTTIDDNLADDRK